MATTTAATKKSTRVTAKTTLINNKGLQFTGDVVLLQQAVKVVMPAVAAKGALPILGNIALQSENGQLKVEATNLETGITTWIAGTINVEGGITVSGDRFAKFLAALPKRGTVQLSVNDKTNTLHVKAGRSEANIKGIDIEEFPCLPVLDGFAPTFTVDAGLLATAIDQVAFAAAAKGTVAPSQVILEGVLMRLNGKDLTFAATDSFTLAEKKMTLDEASAITGDLLIPAEALMHVSAVLAASKYTGPVAVMVTPNHSQVLFHTEGLDVVIRIIDGTYPQYQRIFPKEIRSRVVIDRAEFQVGAAQALIFAENNIVKVSVLAGEGLLMGANAPEAGDNQTLIEGKVEGAGGEIAFNLKFVREALRESLTSKTLIFDMKDDKAPGVFQLGDDASLRVIVMPMTLH